MRYRPVDRIVTVEFDRLKGTKAYEVRITPEVFVARHRDRIVWVIQGLTQTLADLVTFGGFELLSPVARVSQTSRGLVPHANGRFTKSVIGFQRGLKRKLETDTAELGHYKYTIYFDGKPLIDPEGEVKGPRS